MNRKSPRPKLKVTGGVVIGGKLDRRDAGSRGVPQNDRAPPHLQGSLKSIVSVEGKYPGVQTARRVVKKQCGAGHTAADDPVEHRGTWVRSGQSDRPVHVPQIDGVVQGDIGSRHRQAAGAGELNRARSQVLCPGHRNGPCRHRQPPGEGIGSGQREISRPGFGNISGPGNVVGQGHRVRPIDRQSSEVGHHAGPQRAVGPAVAKLQDSGVDGGGT